MTLTFAFSIIWNVEVGIVVSIIISLLLVVRRSSKTRMAILVCSILVTVMITITTFVWAFQGRIPGTDRWKPINENQDAQEEVPGVLIIRIRESLDFGPSFDSRSLCPLRRIFTHN